MADVSTLVRWRSDSRRGTLDARQVETKGRVIARISDIQLLLVVAIVIAATMMARGYG